VATNFIAVPDWFSWQNESAGVAVADLNGDGRPEIVVFMIDHPTPGPNAGWYRIGRNLNQAGDVSAGWGPWQQVPGWFSWENQAGGCGIADVNGNGHPDIVVFMIDHPTPGPNAGWYRIGWDVDADGAATGGWSPWMQVPDWFSWENQGGDIAIADLDGDGRPEIIIVMVDNPPGQNGGYYRAGWKLDVTGAVTGGWTPWTPVPDWFSWENQGAGCAIADLNGDGHPELLVFQVDHPTPGPNGGWYTVGWHLDATGRAADGWGPWTAVPDWRFWENQGAGVALADVDASGNPAVIAITIDHPPPPNQGYYAVLPLVTDLDTAAAAGVWRLLDFDTQVLAIHAALLHTGDVLLFSGSSNNPANLAAHQFRSRAWHYPTATFSVPDTPIDLFCCGHAFLPDGRLLAAGGTEQYDPFHGLRSAVIFDPATLAWSTAPDMDGGRWYPALVGLPDGRVLAISGLGEDGNLNLVPETYTDGAGWTDLASPGPWPQYANIFVLGDGRVFYSGGQYGGNNGVRPTIWNPATAATSTVPGLPVPDMRNQSASVLLPPAQDQRVLIAGGGGSDMHNQAPAIADTGIADLSAANPAYAAGPPLHAARMHLNLVTLPDRTVLASGGAAMPEDPTTAALGAELYDPRTQAWTAAANARVPRLYHSVALLMPDGKIITAGSNPQRTVEELRIEVYWPPYLFKGARPTWTIANSQASWGTTVGATSPDASRLNAVSLIRPGATTHSADNEQRLVDVAFRLTAPNTLELDIPASKNLLPPGWYLLFATDAGSLPTDGAWIRLS
jgi:Domain of unknown function (DUF1929)/FG-GAP-like repeat